jgi:hypothetical protein
MIVTKARLLKFFVEIANSIEANDSFEGVIEWSCLEEGLVPGEFELHGFYRIGNSEGQGGSRLIPASPASPDRGPAIPPDTHDMRLAGARALIATDFDLSREPARIVAQIWRAMSEAFAPPREILHPEGKHNVELWINNAVTVGRLNDHEQRELLSLLVSRSAYRDDRCAQRKCENCGEPYRGPAIYCCHACATADA